MKLTAEKYFNPRVYIEESTGMKVSVEGKGFLKRHHDINTEVQVKGNFLKIL